MTTETIETVTLTPRPSELHRLALCPGSWAASIGITAESSPDAERGTRLHTHMAADTLPTDPAEAELILRARTAQNNLLASYEDMFILSKDHSVYTEQKLTGSIGRHTISGTPDRVIVNHSSKSIIVIDYKFGHEPVHAKDNPQLEAYAILAAQNYLPEGCNFAMVAIIQPTLRSDAVDRELDLTDSLMWLESILNRATAPAAPRYPSAAACRYCPASTTCSAAAHTLAQNITDISVADLSPERRAELLTRIQLAEKLCTKYKAELRALLESDPLAIPGWRLAPGATRRSISTENAWTVASAHGITPQEMLTLCTVSVTALEKALTDKTAAEKNITKKEAKTAITAALLPHVITSQNSPTLKQI